MSALIVRFPTAAAVDEAESPLPEPPPRLTVGCAGCAGAVLGGVITPPSNLV
jgi:hypothetical protein